MPTYRKKPVEVEAFQLPEKNDYYVRPFHEWAEDSGFTEYESGRDQSLIIKTLEGDMEAQPGDWIIKGIAGEFYPCKPDIFEATYEPV